MSNRNENGAEKLLADVLAENAQIPAGPGYQAYISGTYVGVGDSRQATRSTLSGDIASRVSRLVSFGVRLPKTGVRRLGHGNGSQKFT